MMAKYILNFLLVLLFGNIVTGIENYSNQEFNYTTSIIGMTRLLHIEEQLVNNLGSYMEVMARKLSAIRRAVFLSRSVLEKALINSNASLMNPLKKFVLKRRMQLDWLKCHGDMERQVGLDNSEFIVSLRGELPSTLDFEEATAGIYRLQTTYLLKAKDIANGILNGKQYNAKFSVLDCYAMGEYLSDQKQYMIANDWFFAAQKQCRIDEMGFYKLMGVELSNIWYMIAKQWLQLGAHEKSREAIAVAKQYKANDKSILQFEFDLKTFMQYKELCAAALSKASRLHCHYNSWSSALAIIAPFKVEEVTLDPYIVICYDVIFGSEIEEIRELSVPMLQRAVVDLTESAVKPTYKVATIAENQTKTAKRINNRIAAMTGYDLKESLPLQVVNYGIGGHHQNHIHNNYLTKPVHHSGKRDDRLLLAIFYMNDLDLGGSDVFPTLYKSITPKKGNAVLIHLINTGDIESRILHSSCPVVIGSKWVLVKVVLGKREEKSVYKNKIMF